MIKSKPYTIAFLSNNFHSEYCHSMYSGIRRAVSELGVSLITISGGDLENPGFNNVRRNRVFNLVNPEDFDGIIFQSGSLRNFISDESFLKFCSQFDSIPSVHIGFKKEGLSSVLVDNRTGMKELIDHFIEVHQRKDIAFISGPKGCTDAIERFEAYKDSLKAHGIPFRDDLVYMGNFLPESGQKAIKEFTDIKKARFDAVVGANDQMALFAMNELIRRGLKVPNDIIVGGFDDLISARACSPALCTVRQPVRELGEEALKLLINIIEGKTAIGTCAKLPSRLILRRSCSCISVPFAGFNTRHTVNSDCFIFETQFERILQEDESAVSEFIENQVIFCLKKGFNLTDLLSKLGYILDKHAQQISPDLHNAIRRILLTLSEEHFETRQLKQQEEGDQLYNFIDDLRKISEPDDLREFLDTQLINFGIKDFFISRYKNNDTAELFYSSISNQKSTVFAVKQLVPGGLKYLPAPFDLICLPLYAHNTDIGFFLINSIESSPVLLETIRSSLCGTFQMMDMLAKEREYGSLLEKKVQERTTELEEALKELSIMNDKLETLSVKDELTGLLNRRGFLSMAGRYISLAQRNKSSFICIFFDLDNLKQINDTYGHAHGDVAIKSMAEILTRSFRKTDVIGRMGGDEFTVLVFECLEFNYPQILKRIDSAVFEYNQTNRMPWKLGYSSGLSSSEQEHAFDIDVLLKLADQALYKVKVEKKSRKQG